jgi:hypothetical protein
MAGGLTTATTNDILLISHFDTHADRARKRKGISGARRTFPAQGEDVCRNMLQGGHFARAGPRPWNVD